MNKSLIMVQDNVDKPDIISSLPEPLIVKILSRLPIKTAATTSMLSQRWRHLWTELIEFHNVTEYPPDFSVVDRVHSQLISPEIRVFRLHSDYLLDFYDDTPPPYSVQQLQCMESCFDRVCRKKVKEIYVDLQEIAVPSSVFNCQSLEVLNIDAMLLCNNLHSNPIVISLPNLKKLSLDLSESSTRLLSSSLIKSCPLLEDLHLSFYMTESTHNVDIFAPNLKVLDICNIWAHERNNIRVNAPKLVNLSIDDCSSSYCFLENPTTLAKERIRQCVECGLRCHEDAMSTFFRDLSSVSYLELNRKASILPYLKSEGCRVLKFRNLTHLNINLCNYSYGWHELLRALHCFPKLEVLDVFGGLAYWPLNWSFPESVPVSLTSKLKRMCIGWINGTRTELVLLQYILGNASVLERLILVCSKHVDGSFVIDKNFYSALLNLRRSSLICRGELCGEYVKRQEMPSRPRDCKFEKYLNCDYPML